MKKLNKKKVTIILATVMCLGTATCTFSASEPPTQNETIAPTNLVILSTTTNLTLGQNGKLTCFGRTIVNPDYVAGVIVELQQNTGTWGTIKTWSAERQNTATVNEDYTVSKGYSYRLKLTHKAYDSSGKLVESIPKYSNIVNYN